MENKKASTRLDLRYKMLLTLCVQILSLFCAKIVRPLPVLVIAIYKQTEDKGEAVPSYRWAVPFGEQVCTKVAGWYVGTVAS